MSQTIYQTCLTFDTESEATAFMLGFTLSQSISNIKVWIDQEKGGDLTTVLVDLPEGEHKTYCKIVQNYKMTPTVEV